MRAARAFIGSFVFVACRSVAGIEDEPRPADDAPACSIAATGNGACRECLLASCCEEGAACGRAPGCGELTTCAWSCAPDDAACAAECRARRKDAWASPAISLASCRAVHCAEPCSVRCGGWVHPDRECATCAADRCCDASARCMADASCAALSACERACKQGDASCLLACELAWPEGVTAARAFGACIATECAPACVTQRWACLREPADPAPANGPPIALNYRFVDYVTLEPLPALTVRACRREDLECSAPLASASTDVNGSARLALTTNVFDGYVEVTGDDYGPVLVYFPRLTKSFVTGSHPLLSRATYATLAGALAPLRTERGSVLAAVRDCNGERAAGVAFAVEPSEGATPFFSVGRGASASATATTDDGFSAGGFVNVAANTALTIRATVQENGLSYAPSIVSVRNATAGYTLTYLFAVAP